MKTAKEWKGAISYYCLRCDRELGPDEFDYHAACHPTPELEKLRAELEAARKECAEMSGNWQACEKENDRLEAERDALLGAARAVVETGFFIPAILALRDAVSKSGAPPPMSGAEFVEKIHDALPDAFADESDVP